jgi:hypothetical protein
MNIALSEEEEALILMGLVALTVAHIAKTTCEGALLVFLLGLDAITKLE